MQVSQKPRSARPESAAAILLQSRLLDVIVVSFALVVSVVSIAGIVSPAIPLAIRNDDLDRAISGVAAGIAAMAALLQWNRYREDQDPPALLQASALLVLAAANGANLVIGIAGLGDDWGFTFASPGQAPVYGWLVSRFLAAALFALAAVAELRTWSFEPRPAWAFAIGMATLAALAFPFFSLFEERLPILYDVAGLASLTQPEGQSGVAPGTTATIIAANLLLTALLIAAARLHKIIAIRTGRPQASLLSLALIIGALSQLQFAIVPPSYFGLVSAGDLLRVAFYGYLVLVFDADTLTTMHELRVSQDRVEELRESDLNRVVVAERARLSREVHDGLAQDLWLAKLRIGRLVKAFGDKAAFDQEARALDAAIDDAIAEARLAIVAMNVRPDEPQNLEMALGRYVRDLTQRMDIPVTFRAGTRIPPLPAQASEEILRAVHEALTNVRRHAEASSAKVILDADEEYVRVAVEDDGRGIPAGAIERSSGYGLKGMRQRIESIGGELQVDSRGWGTRVLVKIPAPAPTGLAGRTTAPDIDERPREPRATPATLEVLRASAGRGSGSALRGGAAPRSESPDDGPAMVLDDAGPSLGVPDERAGERSSA
jgi:signal transduction histidine kinase